MPSVSKRVEAVATRETMSLASSILEPFSSKATLGARLGQPLPIISKPSAGRETPRRTH
jgi:hypothetical protein